MEKIIELMKKYKSFILYAVFGVFTTAVNLAVYHLCYYQAGLSNTLSNVFAWVMAVTFAYLTNKSWVFDSKSWAWSVLCKEIPSFVSCRLATGFMDLAIMYVCVDLLGWHAMLMKLVSNVLVIILNYIFSKLVIFRKK